MKHFNGWHQIIAISHEISYFLKKNFKDILRVKLKKNEIVYFILKLLTSKNNFKQFHEIFFF